MKSTVVVTMQLEGFHRWKDAESIIPEVGFLAKRHRHIFHIRCERQVFHDDRDVEFIVFKRQIQKYITGKWGSPCEFGDLSCEAIARELAVEFKLIMCEVMEDNENGGRVYNN